jgi:hypothetical protein
MPGAEPPYKRFLRGYEEDDSTGCWIWGGSKYPNGYGWLKVFGKPVSVHRFSYELHKGPIPDGLEILHLCDVKDCVNPDHLRTGTHAENMKEASERGLLRKGENHPMFGKKNPRPMQANRVMVLGVEYESQNQAEIALGLGKGTVRYWLKTNNEKAKLIKGKT